MKKETFKDKSDEDLMESYKMGEVVAFELLFERHSGKVLSYLSKRLQAPKEAQDLLQEVFFKLHRSRHQYNRTLPFSPWLFSITRSMWIDFLKKRRLEDATFTVSSSFIASISTSYSFNCKQNIVDENDK